MKSAQELKRTASKEISSIASYILAWHCKSKKVDQFTILLKESIQEFPGYVMNYTDLGKHYLATGNAELGKKLIEEGLANVKLIYSNSDKNYDPTDVARFIDERITGVYMAEDNYRSLNELIQS